MKNTMEQRDYKTEFLKHCFFNTECRKELSLKKSGMLYSAIKQPASLHISINVSLKQQAQRF